MTHWALVTAQPVRDVVVDDAAAPYEDAPAFERSQPTHDVSTTVDAVPYSAEPVVEYSQPVRDVVVSDADVPFDTSPAVTSSRPRFGIDFSGVLVETELPTYIVEDHGDATFSGFTTFIAVGGADPGPFAQYVHAYVAGDTVVLDQLHVAVPIVPSRYVGDEYDTDVWS